MEEADELNDKIKALAAEAHAVLKERVSFALARELNIRGFVPDDVITGKVYVELRSTLSACKLGLIKVEYWLFTSPEDNIGENIVTIQYHSNGYTVLMRTKYEIMHRN